MEFGVNFWTRIIRSIGWFLIVIICIGFPITQSLDELALVQKQECEQDLGKQGCTGVTSSCDYIGSVVNCRCIAYGCKNALDDDIDRSETVKTDTQYNLENSIPTPSPYSIDMFFPSKHGPKKRLPSVKKIFTDTIIPVLNKQFRLRYAIEGIGSQSRFVRLGFCKIPVEENRIDICFFMHYFLESGFKVLNIRVGNRVTNSTGGAAGGAV